MENLNLLDEAILRLQKAGFSDEITKQLKNGVLPIDYRGITLPIDTEKVFQLAGQLEKSADIVIYGAVAVNYKNDPAVAYLMMNKNSEEWRFDHEMYQDSYPLVFIADLNNPDLSDEGYLELLDENRTRIYRIISPEKAENDLIH